MIDVAAAYEETQQHLADLVLGLSEEEVGATVPASPAWTVKDVVAHLTSFSGRRSTRQIRAMDWTGDPEPYLPLIPAYGERTDPITE
jgi:hypothetical protein